jgi:hypothetical protein
VKAPPERDGWTTDTLEQVLARLRGNPLAIYDLMGVSEGQPLSKPILEEWGRLVFQARRRVADDALDPRDVLLTIIGSAAGVISMPFSLSDQVQARVIDAVAWGGVVIAVVSITRLAKQDAEVSDIIDDLDTALSAIHALKAILP